MILVTQFGFFSIQLQVLRIKIYFAVKDTYLTFAKKPNDMRILRTPIVAALLLTTITVSAQKPLTLENTVPGGKEFREHYNNGARGGFAGQTNIFVTTDNDNYHIGTTVISRQQIGKILADNNKSPFAYIAEWQDTENVWAGTGRPGSAATAGAGAAAGRTAHLLATAGGAAHLRAGAAGAGRAAGRA